MPQSKPAICIDLDNVIARTDEVMREVIHANSISHVDLAYDDVVCFDYWNCRDKNGRRFDKSEWPGIHRQFTEHHISRILPFDNICQFLETIGQKFTIHIATSRLDEGQEATQQWLAENKIPHSKVHFVKNGEKHLINDNFIAAVDDDREQAYAFASKGIRAFILAHPWNEVGKYSPLKRISDWKQLTVELLSIAP
jgi:5'(3')-deoxyribonucleotidase